MSATLDRLKKGYDDYARGDVAAATEAWPDDFVLEGPNAEGLALSGVYEGKEAALRALGALAAAYDAITAWMGQQGREPAGAPWEAYWTGPDTVTDPAEYRTEVLWPIR